MKKFTASLFAAALLVSSPIFAVNAHAGCGQGNCCGCVHLKGCC
ncbi:hypothetical protein [Azorhizobium caulinodans]|nr:hypothetical protein [Azorhizobium caulinodans]